MKKRKPIVNPRKEKEMQDGYQSLQITLQLVEVLSRTLDVAIKGTNKKLTDTITKKLISVVDSIQSGATGEA